MITYKKKFLIKTFINVVGADMNFMTELNGAICIKLEIDYFF